MINTNDTVLYYPIEWYNEITDLVRRQEFHSFGSLYVTVLQSSATIVSSYQDLFGRMKIPDISALKTSKPADPGTDWVPVRNASDVAYTSLFGVLIAGLPIAGNASFSIKTHYWTINCSSEDQPNNPQPWNLNAYPYNTKLAGSDPPSPSFAMVVDENKSTNDTIRFQYLSRILRDE